MKKTAASLALLALAVLTGGCTIYKGTSEYRPDPLHAQQLAAAIEAPVNIGAFTDASFRKELTCRSLAIVEAPRDWTYADAIRFALIDELAQAGRFDPQAPVTITAQLNRIDFETEKGSWIIRMTLTSSNGKSMVAEETFEYGAFWYGELACTQAAFNYSTVLDNFMKHLIFSPEFADLCKNTPPPVVAPEAFDPAELLENEAEAEEKARAIGRERIRQTDSLDPTRKHATDPL